MTVRDCIERLKLSFSSGGVPQNEEMTKLQVIVPILDELGWDVTNRRGTGEVKFEFSVGSQKSKGRVDIALLDAQGRATCLVEAKAPSKDLADHVDQLLGYAFYEGASVCALTTGTLWWLYLPRERGAFGDRRFAELDLVSDDTDELSRDFLRFLSHKSLDSGRAEREAKAALSHRQEAARIEEKLPALWQQMVSSKPDPELVELVRRRLLDTEHLQASTDQVAAVIAGRQIPATQSMVAATGANPSASNRSVAAKKAHMTRAKNPRPVAIEILGVRVTVRTWRDLYLSVIAFLYERYPYRFLDAANQVLGGWKRPATSTNPNDYFIPHEVGSTGVFVEIQGSGRSMEDRSRKLVRALGHAEADLVVHLAE